MRPDPTAAIRRSEPARSKGSLRLVAGVAAIVPLAVAGWLVLLALASTAFGWRPTVITSGSMAPGLAPGDVVLAEPGPVDRVTEGTIVVFEAPDGGRVTHRVVGVNDDGTFTTKGDANSTNDSSPVAPHGIVGSARLLVPFVGLPYLWVLGGDWTALAVTVLSAGALTYAARLGLGRRIPTPGTARPAVSRARIRRASLRATAALAVGAMALSAASAVRLDVGPLTARSAFSAGVGNPGSTFSAAPSFPLPPNWYLKTEGIGNRTSTPVLPLSQALPVQAVLPNYDTNRDSAAGLLVAKGSGLGETDAKKYQIWDHTVTDALSVGSVELRLWSAMKNFNATKKGAITVGLYDCNGAKTSCSLFRSQSLAPSSAWSGGSSSWVEKTFTVGSELNRTIAAGRVLRLKLVVQSSSDDDMWFAYDTLSHPSRLEITAG